VLYRVKVLLILCSVNFSFLFHFTDWHSQQRAVQAGSDAGQGTDPVKEGASSGKEEPDSGQHALKMALHTLRMMARGGIHDHIGQVNLAKLLPASL